MTAIAPLLTRLDALAWRLEQGAFVDAQEFEGLADELDAADRGDPAMLHALHARLSYVMGILATARDRLGERLGEAGRGRRAVRAYHAGGRG
jgi:hypothetical protein